MATYQRSNLAFPGTAASLFERAETNGDQLLEFTGEMLLQIPPQTNEFAFLLDDGTTLRLVGNLFTQVSIVGSYSGLAFWGTITGVVRLSNGGDVLEQLSGLSEEFHVVYVIGPGSPGVLNQSDFPTWSGLFSGPDNVIGGSVDDLLKGYVAMTR